MSAFNEYPRRFIAGAVCPECNEVDTTVIYATGNIVVRHCVHCNFEDYIQEGSSLPSMAEDVEGLFSDQAEQEEFTVITEIK